MGILYIVATPIGNLDDITYRGVKTLGEVDVIACEDTRHSQKLLSHYGISKPRISCYAGKEDQSARKIVELLGEEKNVAYVSDAGTPGISDPGAALVSRVVEAGFTVVPIPGPSAVTALLSAAGISGRTCVFDGFLSPKQGKRKKRLEELLLRGENFLFFESPHRIIKTLTDLVTLDTQRTIVVGRELTKFHEEIIRGTPEKVLEFFSNNDKIRGEFGVLVAGRG